MGKKAEGVRRMNIIWIILIILAVIFAAFVLCNVIMPAFHDDIHDRTFEKESEKLGLGEGTDERIYCIDDNREALTWRLRAIESAEDNIILTTYSWLDDESGRDIMASLNNAADRGIHIRLLVDGLSAFTNIYRSDMFRALAAHENVETKIYNPVTLTGIFKVNYRMHDKYLMVDDEVYILGGRNTRDVSLGEYREDLDIDRDIIVYSPEGKGSLGQVKDYFEDMWTADCVKDFRRAKASSDESQKMRDRYEDMKDLYPEAFKYTDWGDITYGVNSIDLVTNPPADVKKRPEMWRKLCGLMERGDDLYIQTPYIICNGYMYDDLKRLNEDAHMRIITNSLSNGANIFGCSDFINQRKNLLETGADIYERSGERSAHTKTILIDDDLVVTGTFNIDMRSVYLDTEMMLVIDSPRLNEHIKKMDEEYIDCSRMLLEDGGYAEGKDYEDRKVQPVKKVLSVVIRAVSVPFRHLF